MYSILISDTPDDGQQYSQVSSISIEAYQSYVQDNNMDEQTDVIVYTPWTSVVEYKQLSVND